MEIKYIENGSVTSAKGFTANGICAGVKASNTTKKDLALIYCDKVCNSAAIFTKNLVKSDTIYVTKKHLENGTAQAVVVNSGNANACNPDGYEKAEKMCSLAADALGVDENDVIVASTGVIGQPLPIEPIASGIEKLKGTLSKDGGISAAEAIMTTDTKSKEVACTLELDGKQVTVAGMCKGSGMIHPNMCTMLCFVTTDVAISHELLQKALSEDVVDTFNMISVDGDTSTNDTVLVMANGQAENTPITKEGEDYKTFCEALHFIMLELSKKIAGDGEGCTCLFEATVIGAKDKNQARTIAKSVVCSSLTKAAVFGHDANWGRILCAMGYSGAQFDPEVVDIWLESKAGTIKIVENGIATDYSEETATKILSEEEVIAKMDIKEGNETATAFGCDLTYEYVKINGDYRS